MVYSSHLGVVLHYQWLTVWVKSGFSTTFCTGVLKAFINCYLSNSSKVYACLIDAFKAFDLVNHCILFDKLLDRGTPKPVVHLLLRWYRFQQLCIHWMGRSSEYFQVTNGVCQGGVLRPILFTIYFDSLLEVKASSRGCYWGNHVAGALCYTDDLTILAPSPDVLRKMIADCEAFGQSHGLCFNASKTQLICFWWTTYPVQCHFCFDGQSLLVVDSVVHLGNILQFNLSDKLDIHLKSMSFIRKANIVLFRFECTDPLRWSYFNLTAFRYMGVVCRG